MQIYMQPIRAESTDLINEAYMDEAQIRFMGQDISHQQPFLREVVSSGIYFGYFCCAVCCLLLSLPFIKEWFVFSWIVNQLCS